MSSKFDQASDTRPLRPRAPVGAHGWEDGEQVCGGEGGRHGREVQCAALSVEDDGARDYPPDTGRDISLSN